MGIVKLVLGAHLQDISINYKVSWQLQDRHILNYVQLLLKTLNPTNLAQAALLLLLHLAHIHIQ